MKKVLCLLVLLTTCLPGCVFSRNDAPGFGVIYGDDDRTDYYEIKDPLVKANADAVGGIYPTFFLINLKNGTYELKTLGSFGEMFKLEDDERFYDQPIAYPCTVFLTSPTTIVTAGHCVYPGDRLDLMRIVFGFHMNSESDVNTVIPESQIFGVKRIIARVLDRESKTDFAVLELDRPCTNIQPVKLAKEDIGKGEYVYLIGYPNGLPLKYAPNGWVKKVNSIYFTSSVDSFSGNSGSPIFNKDHEVVGILVRGLQDFQEHNGKFRPARVSQYYPTGEDATNVSVWRKYIK